MTAVNGVAAFSGLTLDYATPSWESEYLNVTHDGMPVLHRQFTVIAAAATDSRH